VTVLALSGICKDYPTGEEVLRVLRDVDLSVEEGEFVGVIGASGSGKTTLMNILGCLDRPTRGTYHLDGRDVASLDDDRLAVVRSRSVGFVFQSFNLIPQLTVLENVEVPLFYDHVRRGERRGRCLELLESVGLAQRLGHYPPQLSGGESQRTAIARALVNRPALVLCDEPTGNLDRKSGEEVLALFHALHGAGRTIVMVTHNTEIARAIPRVVELRDGRVVRDSGRGAARRVQAEA